MASARGDGGQASPEWVALLLVVALALAGAVSAAPAQVPGQGLARQITARMLCAVRFESACRDEPALDAAYGEETARLVQNHLPALAYEEGMRALPVDFRTCRDPACALGDAAGELSRSRTGAPVTVFVHVARRGGERWIQYWFYYPDSATLRGIPVAGRRGYHRDDWEGLQVRVGPGGRVSARATSHNGYHQRGGIRSWASDTGFARGSGWGGESGWLFVSGGSHAGAVQARSWFGRYSLPRDISLVPMETLPRRERYRFAVAPPWRKQVWSDPEALGTG